MKADFVFGGISVNVSKTEYDEQNLQDIKTAHAELKEVKATTEYTPEEFNNMIETNANTLLKVMDKVPECMGKIADTFFETYSKAKDLDM